ncbi:MAG: hypothetical protein ACREJO_03270 [Phycisphaerales bacterium]
MSSSAPLTMSAILGMGHTPIKLPSTRNSQLSDAADALAESFDAADTGSLLSAMSYARDAAILGSPQPTPITYSFPLSFNGAFPGSIGISGGWAPVNETFLFLRAPTYAPTLGRLSVGDLINLAA